MSDLPELNSQNFFNRELSTIAFNVRVLSLARDENLPLLERLKFVAIVGNNLDESFMVRVGSYIQKQKLGMKSTRPDGIDPAQLLREIRRDAMHLMGEQRKTMQELLLVLAEKDIHILQVNELETIYQEAVRAYFYEEVFPVLTPLAADYARPFPFISNLSLNIGVYLRDDVEDTDDGPLDFVRIKVPEALPRLINLGKVMEKYAGIDGNTGRFLWLEDVISENLDLLFPGMEIIENVPFRVTRNADIDYEHEQEDDMLDLSAVIEAGVRERRFGFVTRLSVPNTISPRMLERLIYELQVDPESDVYQIEGALGSADLFELVAIDRPELKFRPYVPRLPEPFAQAADIFSAIRNGDILVHHPYDSFSPVEDFFRIAARDPQVLAIKTTLYRVGKNSSIVQALLDARENGKQVAVLVELKARFDEENNLEWARALENEGVHVTYGVEKLPVKTHAKIALVIRKEASGLRRYVHLGTGNYNASTARLYSDLALFTVNEQIAEDATRLFNRLTGFAPDTQYQRLLVAPEYLLNTFEDLIDNEIQAAKAGKPGRIIFKMNQIEEDLMIRKLYQASQAGVQIDLIIRGICCLRPGIPGLSENIRVRSILGRFLEHPRIYYFSSAPETRRMYAGSADLMRRNLYNRVEVVFPILEQRLQRRILRLLATDLQSNVHTWLMDRDGNYHPAQVSAEETLINSQEVFMNDSFGLDLLPV